MPEATLLSTVRDIISIGSKVNGALKLTSLVEATKMARVEPITVISKDCTTVEYLPEINQTLLNLFVGYYLMAVTAYGTMINNVQVASILDKFNPDRRRDIGYAFESLKDMPTLDPQQYKLRLPIHPNKFLALEDDGDYDEFIGDSYDKVIGRNLPTAAAGDKDLGKTLYEASNLAVGKLINITLTVAGNGTSVAGTVEDDDNKRLPKVDNKFTIPVSIRLATAILPFNSVLNILASDSEDNSFTERFYKWRAGRIGFIQDLILCQDLIREKKKALVSDESGIYAEIVRRANNNKRQGILSMNPSIATVSNIFVITEREEKELSARLGGRLSKKYVRDKMLSNSYTMIIAIVDRDHEHVTIYTHGIDQPTITSLRDIKIANKSKGPNILDIFKALNQGQAPSF